MAMKTIQIRQGDVLVHRRKAVRAATPKPVDPRGVVLAEGEATGHCHRIVDPDVCSLRAEGVAYDILRVTEGATSLVHDEHATIHVGPGTYEIRLQVEWDYLAHRARQVQD